MYPFSFLKSQNSFTTPSLALEFDSIANANLLVGDASDVDDWNDFFDLPINGNPFTLVEVIGKKVYLVGGSNINLKDNIFYSNVNLLSVVDTANCIISAGNDCFYECSSATLFNLPVLTSASENCFDSCESVTIFNLPQLTIAGYKCFSSCQSVTIFNLPLLTTAGSDCFDYCYSATIFNLPLLETVGNNCFDNCRLATYFNLPSCINLGSTVGDNNVFVGIIGNTITLEIAKALLTCNSGNPDGDIEYLQLNNTVTVVMV